MVEAELPEKAGMVRLALRIDDVPRSFYPGMWLRRADEGQPWREPTSEVVSVGRTRVSILSAGCIVPERLTVKEAQGMYRKVYETPPPTELPEWIHRGAEFTAFTWEAMRVRRVRWAYASVETIRGVLMFWHLEGLAKKGQPRRNIWDRLLDDER